MVLIHQEARHHGFGHAHRIGAAAPSSSASMSGWCPKRHQSSLFPDLSLIQVKTERADVAVIFRMAHGPCGKLVVSDTRFSGPILAIVPNGGWASPHDEDEMSLHRIKLDLIAVDKAANWRDCSYDLVVPLDRDGYLSMDGRRRKRAECTVRRLESGRPERQGYLSFEPGGPCTIRYHAGQAFDILQHPDALRFLEGEHVTIQERGGVLRLYRVNRVRPVLNCVA